MRFTVQPNVFDDLEGLKCSHLDHFGALRGLARRTDLGFWGPDPTKSESRELSVYFFLVNLKQKVSYMLLSNFGHRGLPNCQHPEIRRIVRNHPNSQPPGFPITRIP